MVSVPLVSRGNKDNASRLTYTGHDRKKRSYLLMNPGSRLMAITEECMNNAANPHSDIMVRLLSSSVPASVNYTRAKKERSTYKNDTRYCITGIIIYQ